MKSYVYAIQNTSDKAVKIRSANNPKVRLRTLQTGSAAKLVLIAQLERENALQAEKAIHKTFFEYNCGGEWFNLPAEIIDRLPTIFAEYVVPTGDALSRPGSGMN